MVPEAEFRSDYGRPIVPPHAASGQSHLADERRHLDPGRPARWPFVFVGSATVSVVITMNGVTGYDDLVATLSELDGVLAVNTTTPQVEADLEVE
jgi:hypothetical protein